jgi:uncharacterized cupredoxin-like copper-binding protein
MRRHPPILLAAALAVVVATFPSVAGASHEVTDERPTTSLEDFVAQVAPWVDPWIEISDTSIADDHAPWLAFSLYDVLLGTRPERCYIDTYAAYWAVAADLRTMGQATTPADADAAKVRVLEDLKHASELAEGNVRDCRSSARGEEEAVVDEPGRGRVIELDATAALEFTDPRGNRLDTIEVTPGETVVFRVHNVAGFEHSFYIGTEAELEDPGGTTDVGIPGWDSGVRELQWTVPDDVSGLMFGCTVPGHFVLMHGTFTVTSAG